MRRDVRAYLADIVDACRRIAEFTQGANLRRYEEDALLRSAVERQLTVVGEALRQALALAPEVADRVVDAPTIVAFRNRLVHGYMAIEHATVWGVIEGDLPLLERQVRDLIEELDGDEGLPSEH